MRKKLISYFLISLISIQLIPLKELRESISKNNITQELLSDIENEESEEKKNDDIKKTLELFHFLKPTQDLHSTGNDIKYNVKDFRLNSRISDDIPTRPPLSLI